MAKIVGLKLCRACLRERPETEFYRRSDRKQYRHKCKECEREKRPTVLRERRIMPSLDQIMVKEGRRFFICNVKRCSYHKIYHPLAAFSRRADKKDLHQSACRCSRRDREREARQKAVSKYAIQRYLCGMKIEA